MDNFLYQQLADKVSGWIEQRTLLPGEKIPSVRTLSQRENVSLGTVLQAYILLENRGIIEARPQSGYYVRLQTRELPPEPSISRPSISASIVGSAEVIARIHEANAQPDVIPLGGAVPGPELLPTHRLNRIMASVARHTTGQQHLYADRQGVGILRHQIARRSVNWGGALRPDEIVITNGGTEAIYLCLCAVAEMGDTIAVESPTYYGFLQMIEALGMKALEIPSDSRDGMDLTALKNALHKNQVKACLVISNFNNPLGSCMPISRKKQLVELLEKNKVALIEDDIYGDLYFTAERPEVCKNFDKYGNVLLCSSFSKVLSPSYRVGWVAPGQYLNQIKKLKFTTTSSSPFPTQATIAEMLKSGGYDRHLRRIRKAYSLQVHNMMQAIRKYFPEGTRCTRPRGGFVLWVEFPSTIDSMELHRRAMKEKISIVPGPLFSARGRYKNFIRLNCSHPWSDKIEQALIMLGKLAAR
ncbi:MAG: GntR family transcriptional regulator [Acidobacteria bacterium]|nr:MAG: GntR family transcriptional regulator [Acidobacteriota bacterium]